MKSIKLLTSVLAVTMICSFAQATSWTVSNDGGRPAQFTVIQDAVDSASPGDTILITGGTYAGFTTVKNLVFYGEAIEAEDFPVTQVALVNLYRLNSSLSASGSRFYGIRFNGGLNINGNFSGAGPGQSVMSDFIFERCRFQNSQSYFYWYDGLSDVTVRNCYFSSHTFYFNQALNTSGLSNFLITNCVFDNSFMANYSSSCCSTDYNGNLVFRNNLFLNRTSDNFRGLIEIVVENNIFYKSEPTGLSLSTFNNNLTYLCNNNTIPYGDNLGSGNIEATDPEFINYPALGGGHSWSYDYGLEATSPAAGTGTNGTDIGLTGGNAPVNQLPIYAKIPGVTLLDIPVSSVPVGGTLQIQIEAESRD